MSLHQSLTNNTNLVKYDVTFKDLTVDTINGLPPVGGSLVLNLDNSSNDSYVPMSTTTGTITTMTVTDKVKVDASNNTMTIMNTQLINVPSVGNGIDFDPSDPGKQVLIRTTPGIDSLSLIANAGSASTATSLELTQASSDSSARFEIKSTNGTLNVKGNSVNIESTGQDIIIKPFTSAPEAGKFLKSVDNTGTVEWGDGGGGGGSAGYPNTIYVSKSIGSDDTGDGTFEKPFATFGKALFGISDNSVVQCMDSQTYDENININNNNITIIAPLAKLVPTSGIYSINLNVNSPTKVSFATIAGTGSTNKVTIATYGNLFINCTEFYSNIDCGAGGYLNLNSSIIGATVTYNAGGGFIYGFVGLNVSPGDITLVNSVQLLQASGVLLS